MPQGIYITDPNLKVTFDGTQRIPKILASVTMVNGDKVRTVTLPREIKGELYYYFQSNNAEVSPYLNPMVFNFKVTASGTVATVEYLQIYSAFPSVTIPFTVYIGEF